MIKRGQIHFASLDPVRGREQAGSRPVLVVSSDAINRLPLVVTVNRYHNKCPKMAGFGKAWQGGTKAR
jgi:mRNA-degrading endonuclease toxin of MazEF toxin-antitoxin module